MAQVQGLTVPAPKWRRCLAFMSRQCCCSCHALQWTSGLSPDVSIAEQEVPTYSWEMLVLMQLGVKAPCMLALFACNQHLRTALLKPL